MFIFRIQYFIDDKKCYEVVRKLRWPSGVTCPHCDSHIVIKRGFDEKERERQRYTCKVCCRNFDDLTLTIFEGRHQPLRIWIICSYFMGLNISNKQIAQELELNESDTYQMTTELRNGVTQRKPEVQIEGEVEFDEVYVVAGHKGQPDVVKAKGRDGRRNKLKGARGRGTLEKEKPPIFGMIQRGGDVCIHMLENVKQKTIAPFIKAAVVKGSMVYTDEYNIYTPLPKWGYQHKTVCHSKGEYARDEDGDGFHEVHVNTMEGFWSLLRSWLRPHRGISQEKLPLYLGFFEFVHNVRKRGKALMGSLIELLLQPVPASP